MKRLAKFSVPLLVVIVAGALIYAHLEPSVPKPVATTTTTTTIDTAPALCSTSKTAATQCATWKPADAWANPLHPPVEVATVALPGGVNGYAIWMRTSGTALGLYLGYKGPAVSTLPRGPEEVPIAGRKNLLAVFNAGFYEADGPAGFYANHTLYYPMKKGLATIERLTNGTVNIVDWTGSSTVPADVVMARQNLPLLVNDGAVTTLTTNPAAWGSTLHGVPDVWRSALGIDANGNLIYAAAPYQTGASLAHFMVLLHCVRAMELDINPAWPVLATYSGPNAAGPILQVPNPNQVADRFLTNSIKDFFALYSSATPGAPTPW